MISVVGDTREIEKSVVSLDHVDTHLRVHLIFIGILCIHVWVVYFEHDGFASVYFPVLSFLLPLFNYFLPVDIHE